MTSLFDRAYVRAVRRAQFHPPELTLAPGFDLQSLAGWLERIASPAVRILTRGRLENVLSAAPGS